MSTLAAAPRTYRNPVLPGFHPDPSVCRVGEDFYLVTSSFHCAPGLPLYHSRDLVHWQPVGHAMGRPEQLDLQGCPSSLGLFAATLRYHAGRFWLVGTHVGLRRNFLVSAEHIAGPWSDPLWLDWPGIDPSLFFDDADGRCWLTGNGGFLGDEPKGIYQAEFDPHSGQFLSPRRLIWAGTGAKAPEGPHLYRQGGWVHLLIAEGGTESGHLVSSARSRSPDGPFEANPHNPVLSHRSLDHPLQATGHADLVQLADGHWWAVLLCHRPAPLPFAPARHHLGRETVLAPVHWTDEGWPQIGAPAGRVELEMAAPDLPAASLPVPQDDLSQGRAPLHWLGMRALPPARVRFDELPGVLVLHGSATALDGTDGLVFIGRRQQHFDCAVAVRLRFVPTQPGDEAGLTAYMSEAFHVALALAWHEGRRQLILRRRVGTLWCVERAQPWDADEAHLLLRADAGWHHWSACAPGAPAQWLGDTECAFLSTEIAGGFTGVLLGLYATGTGRDASAPAVFDHFSYRAL